MWFLQRTAVFDLILEGTFCLTFVRRDVCELSDKWMRYFCRCCCRCRFEGPWWQRSELHLQAKPAECRPEKMGLWGTRLEMTPPSGTLKQICSSVSHVCGVIDSSARKNKSKFLSDCWIGCKEKGQWLEAAGPGVLENGTLSISGYTHSREASSHLLSTLSSSSTWKTAMSQLNSSSCPSSRWKLLRRRLVELGLKMFNAKAKSWQLSPKCSAKLRIC